MLHKCGLRGLGMFRSESTVRGRSTVVRWALAFVTRHATTNRGFSWFTSPCAQTPRALAARSSGAAILATTRASLGAPSIPGRIVNETSVWQQFSSCSTVHLLGSARGDNPSPPSTPSLFPLCCWNCHHVISVRICALPSLLLPSLRRLRHQEDFLDVDGSAP